MSPVLLLPALVCFAAPPVGEPAVHLVQRLGSADGEARRAAAAALLERGGLALPALRAAANHDDAEVRRQARRLADQIGRAVASARVLTPTLVRLRLEDVPAGEAVERLARASGLAVEASGETGRRVTLDVVDAPFWDVLGRIERQGGLSTVVESQDAVRGSAAAFREVRRLAYIGPDDLLALHRRDGPLTVSPGAARAGPECVVGALRLRLVVSPPGLDGLCRLALRVEPEPGLAWQSAGGTAGVVVVDGGGQGVPFTPAERLVPALTESVGVKFLVGRRAVLPQNLGYREVPLGTIPAGRRLREVRGVLHGVMRGREGPLAVLDRPFGAGPGRAVADDGTVVRVTAARRGPGGAGELTLETDRPALINDLFPPGVDVAPVNRFADGLPLSRGPLRFRLEGGGRWTPDDGAWQPGEGDRAERFTLEFGPGSAAAERLVVVGRAQAEVAVPFVFRLDGP